MAQLDGTEASFEVSEPSPGCLLVALGGDYDIATLGPLEPQLGALLNSNAESVVVDLAGLRFMDSSGVAVLLRIARRFGEVEVLNPSPIICRMIRGLGLSEALRVPPG